MNKKNASRIAGLTLLLSGGMVAGATFGGVGVSSAQTAPGTTVATTATAAKSADTATRTPETPLTGDVATKVTAAAQAAVPGGTIIRVETDSDGVYEAHMTTADGKEVEVQIGADFTVTKINERGADGRGDHGGRGGRGDHGTPLTGDVATKVTAAAQAAVPGGTVKHVYADGTSGNYEAHATKADGTRVEIMIDANFAVTSVQDRPARGDHDKAPGDESSTVAPSTTTTK
jgi:uncharacterized membrane protein YkoI